MLAPDSAKSRPNATAELRDGGGLRLRANRPISGRGQDSAGASLQRPPHWQGNEARRGRRSDEFRPAADADHRPFPADKLV